MKRTYEEALHAVQSGVAMKTELKIGEETAPKHLRVGVNSAMCDHAALVRLLVVKGVITEDEYLSAIAQSMNDEADRYEKELSGILGRDVVLA